MQARRSRQLDGLPAHYYAPGCRIFVEGKELEPEIIADILQVTVTLELDALAQFSLGVNNWDSQNFAFKYTDRRRIKDAKGGIVEVGVFELGNRLQVELGYGGDLTILVRGEITTLSPRFPESGSPTIGVTGHDGLIWLRDRKPLPKEQKKWTGKRDSEIAKDVARRNNLAVRVDESPLVHPVVFQQDQNDARFLLDRAKRVDFDCFVGIDLQDKERRDTLFFVRPRDGRDSSAINVHEFEWGRNLISFNPTLTLSRQVSKVTVRGWDAREMKAIVATATAKDLPAKKSQREKSGPERVEDRGRSREDVVIDVHVTSQDEAKELAKRFLAERAYDHVTGSLSVIGNPAIRPGDNVNLTRLGSRFDGQYHITKVEHTYGAGGYLSQLQVRRVYTPELQ